MAGLRTSCGCGAVSLSLPAAPKRLTQCSCDFCTRMGVLWAYYPKDKVTVSGPTDTYARAARRLLFHRCKTCGMLTHWSADTVDWQNTGVNMRGADQALLADVPMGPPE